MLWQTLPHLLSLSDAMCFCVDKKASNLVHSSVDQYQIVIFRYMYFLTEITILISFFLKQAETVALKNTNKNKFLYCFETVSNL